MSDLLDIFDQFEGGIEAPTMVDRHESHALTLLPTNVEVPFVDGVIAGNIAYTIIEVKVQQLELAPREDRLYSQYNLDQDPNRDSYAKTIADRGDLIPPLYVIPLQKTVNFLGEDLPKYAVYHDVVLFGALLHLKRARIQVRIVHNANAGAILLMALSEEQQSRQISLLEKCDAAHRLSTFYGYTQDDIVHHLAKDDTGEDISQSYVSQIISIATLPDLVRTLIHNGSLNFSHARLLASRCAHNETLCCQVANWVVQGGKTRNQLTSLLTQLLPASGNATVRLATHGAQVEVVQLGEIAEVVRPKSPVAASAFVTYPTMLAANANDVKVWRKRYSVTITTNPRTHKVGVTKDSLATLSTWIQNSKEVIPLQELEAALLGYLEAARIALATEQSKSDVIEEDDDFVDGTLEA